MSEIKLIVNGDPEVDVLVSGIEAMLLSGATSITIERVAPVTVEMAVIAGVTAHCEGCNLACTGAHHNQVSGADYRDCHAAACNECEATLCSAECQYQRAIANAQREYDAALENLKRAGSNIQKVVNAHG